MMKILVFYIIENKNKESQDYCILAFLHQSMQHASKMSQLLRDGTNPECLAEGQIVQRMKGPKKGDNHTRLSANHLFLYNMEAPVKHQTS